MQVYEDWMDEWVVFEPNNWHLKDGAPEEIAKAFDEYMNTDDSGIPEIPEIDEEAPVEKQFIFKISKTNNEKRVAFGWSVISRTADGAEVFDLQNDGIDPDELEALAYKYVRFYRDAGALHNSKGKGVLIESFVSTIEKQKIMGIPSGVMPVGWWTGFYVTDDDVWEKVKSGEYAAFSIEGSAVREKV